MGLTQMSYHGLIGIWARSPHAFHFFPHALKVISEQSSTASLSIHIAPYRALVGSEQVVARFLDH
jgi:hypothetical protein